jgi:hypothetical protein
MDDEAQSEDRVKARSVGQSTVGDALAWHDGWHEGYAQALRDAGMSRAEAGWRTGMALAQHARNAGNVVARNNNTHTGRQADRQAETPRHRQAQSRAEQSTEQHNNNTQAASTR